MRQRPALNGRDGGMHMPEQDDPEAGENGGTGGFKAPQSQEELDRMIATRLRREREKFADYDELKAKADQFDELDAASKTEADRLRQENEQLKTRAADLEAKSMRAEVAAEKGLTAAQAKRLVGATREELEADADDLLATFGTAGDGEQQEQQEQGGGGDGFDAGTRSSSGGAADIREVVKSIPRAGTA